jgi:pilus assembly protein FimV
MKPKLLTRLIAGAFFVASTAASAAGLGKLTVLSALGQPLRAEIDLVSVQKDELGVLSARVASPDAYQQAGIEYNPALPSVRLMIEKRPGGQPFIMITSAQPVNEPYLDLLVELNSSAGKLSREYTVLMDPAGLATPVPVALPEGKQTPSEAPQSMAKVAPLEPTEALAASRAADDSYGPVKPGETLSGIARASKPSDISLDQMLVALFKSNPEAFSGKNMNRLKAGKILRLPAASELAALDTSDAAKEVKLQAANWNAYRQQLAASAPAAPDDTPKQASSGRIYASVEDQATGRPTEDVLRLSKADSGGAALKTGIGGGIGANGVQDRMKALEEELTARDKALQEANERVQMLEKSVSDMQRLIEIKSVGGAQAQKEAAAAVQPAQAGTTTEPSKPAEAPVPMAVKPAEPGALGAAPAEAAKPEPQAAATPKPKVVVPPPANEPTLLDSITGEPLYLAAGAGGLALLGALVFMKRRRARKETDAELDSATEHYAAPEGGFESATKLPVASAVPATDEMGTLDEATKYLALGRDAQAEEVLKEALKSQPGQPALLLKLLEVLAGRKDKRAFQSTAQELLAATGGTGEIWLQAVRMGHVLDPENPVYAPAATAAAGTASDLDFDLDVVAPKGVTETDLTVDALQAARQIERTQVMDDNELRRVAQQSGIHSGAAASTFSSAPLETTDFNIDGNNAAVTGTNVSLDDAKADPAGALDINFDLPPEVLGTAPDSGSRSEIRVDLQKPAATPTSSDILDFDLSGISLDLDGTATGMQTSPAAPMKNDHWFDVQTKFDLAKAYQEMGDKDSAREILREVIAEGDAQQQAEAKSLLEALA